MKQKKKDSARRVTSAPSRCRLRLRLPRETADRSPRPPTSTVGRDAGGGGAPVHSAQSATSAHFKSTRAKERQPSAPRPRPGTHHHAPPGAGQSRARGRTQAQATTLNK